MAKFSQYLGTVNVPCIRCYNIVRAGVFERIDVCPHCHSKWNGSK